MHLTSWIADYANRILWVLKVRSELFCVFSIRLDKCSLAFYWAERATEAHEGRKRRGFSTTPHGVLGCPPAAHH